MIGEKKKGNISTQNFTHEMRKAENVLKRSSVEFMSSWKKCMQTGGCGGGVHTGPQKPPFFQNKERNAKQKNNLKKKRLGLHEHPQTEQFKTGELCRMVPEG